MSLFSIFCSFFVCIPNLGQAVIGIYSFLSIYTEEIDMSLPT